MAKITLMGEETLTKKIRRFELSLYRKITNYIEKRRLSYYSNDKYFSGGYVKSSNVNSYGK